MPGVVQLRDGTRRRVARDELERAAVLPAVPVAEAIRPFPAALACFPAFDPATEQVALTVARRYALSGPLPSANT
jgi:hypothetical protein